MAKNTIPSPQGGSQPTPKNNKSRHEKIKRACLGLPPRGRKYRFYGTKEKTDCFADNLEEFFTENRTPYDDDHIDKVNRAVRSFLNNCSSVIPPLFSPHEIWKHCTITLLPKKNKDPKFPLNYRPISPISCVAKLFEKIPLSRIRAFSDTHHLIPDFQHGFRKKISTCHQLLRTINKIIDGFNNHRTPGGVFLDVEKAFDRVWHNEPFKLQLTQSAQELEVSRLEHPREVICPPLLYSLYTYDFPTSPTVEVCLFADAAAILSQSHSPEAVRKNLQSYLGKLKKWLSLWRIPVNTSKSQVIIFKKGNFENRLNPLKLFRNPIPWCDEVLYLGVTLDKKLTFRSHI
ncbi:RNA-directed DNA polymerase from mobile element jockey [Trichonephila clavipes]|uniref:RNA-directed DNA polymerase from mobile element jockey n=1 Tax=Trichonephila clavipes TaxID=2585209 RepID=A0A8X7BKH4_TRICX|nr:RNA-directed DNA polymerase from mobile element jockey [Trichonephila clavipes]